MEDDQILIYQNQEGNIKIDVRLEEETVWLSQGQSKTSFKNQKLPLVSILKTFLRKMSLARRQLFGNSEQFSKKVLGK
jgi:hypothetical protein